MGQGLCHGNKKQQQNKSSQKVIQNNQVNDIQNNNHQQKNIDEEEVLVGMMKHMKKNSTSTKQFQTLRHESIPPPEEIEEMQNSYRLDMSSGFLEELKNAPKINFKEQSFIIYSKEKSIPESPVEMYKGEPQIDYFDADAKAVEIQENMNFSIIPRQEIIKQNSETQLLPVVVQFKIPKISSQHIKPYIDLICVVDTSYSMRGKNIELVMDSLRYIQKILGKNDRIAIVTFYQFARLNLKLTRNTPENKQKIKNAILNMKPYGSTNIEIGVKLGLKIIKERKFKNPVTCMFLLSNAKDTFQRADLRVFVQLRKFKIDSSFIIHTFGYGLDHDANVMRRIANLKGGTFTFVEHIEQVPEYFISTLSRMCSVLAKDVKISIHENSNYKISQIFGDNYSWNQEQPGIFTNNLSYLRENEQKGYALLLEMPSSEKINLEKDLVLKAYVEGISIHSNTKFNKQAELILNFTLKEVQFEQKEIVEIIYLRGKSGDTIRQAQENALEQNYDQAQQILNKMIDEIEASKFIDLIQLKNLLKDLSEIKLLCLPQIFEEKGQAFMLEKQQKHIEQQQSLNNSMEWLCDQEEQMNNFKQGCLDLSLCYQQELEEDSNQQQIPISFDLLSDRS